MVAQVSDTLSKIAMTVLTAVAFAPLASALLNLPN